MTTTHTSGTWFIAEDGTTVLCGDARDPLIICRTEGDDVCHVGNNPDGSETDQPEANARLIASAPELLALLDRLVDAWDAYDDMGPDPLDPIIEAARKVAAKARGKS